MPKLYAYVGNWSFEAHPAKGKGISVFEYGPEDSSLRLIETIRPDVAAGQLFLDSGRRVLYAVNECGERRGEIGGGGYVLAFRIDPKTGKLTCLSERDSLLPEPSYLTMDAEHRHLITCHCADPFHVTKIVRRPDGSFGNEVLFDDTALVMFRINDDGSIGEVCDVFKTAGGYPDNPNCRASVDPVTGHIQLVEVISRLHAVVASPSGKLFIACDKGMDKIYSFAIEDGKLVKKDEFAAEVRTFPRYAAFHPALPVVYCNNEFAPTLNVLRYDEAGGGLERIYYMPVVFRDYGLVDGKPVGAQDILVNERASALYISLCGINEIAVLSLDGSGIPTLVQSVPAGGDLPRGLCLSPDGRFLLSGNMVSGDITAFAVQPDGTLAPTGRVYEAVSPSAIRFFEAEE
ncbi:MAG: beta-propeller fold lactonase family protein [Oscillospiraceae bacterium]|nr:beta-propeller fold lactonase family protein [Oscillospiraceae bacterium]